MEVGWVCPRVGYIQKVSLYKRVWRWVKYALWGVDIGRAIHVRYTLRYTWRWVRYALGWDASRGEVNTNVCEARSEGKYTWRRGIHGGGLGTPCEGIHGEGNVSCLHGVGAVHS